MNIAANPSVARSFSGDKKQLVPLIKAGLARQGSAFIDVIEVPQHDGSIIKLRKAKDDCDPTNRIGAMNQIQSHAAKGEVLTGLLYVNPDSDDLHAHLGTYETAFNKLGEKELCPESGMLEKINAGLR